MKRTRGAGEREGTLSDIEVERGAFFHLPFQHFRRSVVRVCVCDKHYLFSYG